MKLYIKEENLTQNETIRVYDADFNVVYLADKEEMELEIKTNESTVLANVISRDAKWLKQTDIYFDESLVASVKREFSSFVEKKYVEPMDFEIRGEIKNHDIQIYKGKNIIASYSKKWLTYQSAYEISLENNEDQLLIVAIILSLEMANS